VGDDLIHESNRQPVSIGRVEAAARVGNHEPIIPSIEGWARITGYNTSHRPIATRISTFQGVGSVASNLTPAPASALAMTALRERPPSSDEDGAVDVGGDVRGQEGATLAMSAVGASAHRVPFAQPLEHLG